MSQSVNANFTLRSLIATLMDTSGAVTTPWLVNFGAAGLAGLDRALLPGTGAGKATKMWYARSTIATFDDWVIGAGGTNCKDRFNNTVTFTKIKWFLLRAVPATAGMKLKLGAAAANAWTGWFGANTYYEYVPDQTIKFNPLDGWTVNANDTLRVSGDPLTYDILALGE